LHKDRQITEAKVNRLEIGSGEYAILQSAKKEMMDNTRSEIKLRLNDLKLEDAKKISIGITLFENKDSPFLEKGFYRHENLLFRVTKLIMELSSKDKDYGTRYMKVDCTLLLSLPDQSIF
jgi:hypothetical protein